MTHSEKTALRVLRDLRIQQLRKDYEAAGVPFGEEGGLALWVQFGQETTVN